MRADDLSTKARELHFSSIVIDTHADTPQRFLFDRFDLASGDSEGCIDIPRLREGGIGAIFFALWVPVGITGAAAMQRALDLLDAVQEQVRRHADGLMFASSADAIREA